MFALYLSTHLLISIIYFTSPSLIGFCCLVSLCRLYDVISAWVSIRQTSFNRNYFPWIALSYVPFYSHGALLMTTANPHHLNSFAFQTVNPRTDRYSVLCEVMPSQFSFEAPHSEMNAVHHKLQLSDCSFIIFM